MRRTDMSTAVSAAVEDGQTVYLPGFTHLTPFAAGHELIRQEYRDLTLGRMSPDMIYDQLLVAGCLSTCIFSFASRGLRRAIEARTGDPDDVTIEEYTHFSLAARLAAGARDLPFMPLRTFTGSDLPAHNDAIRTVRSPYDDGEELYVVPPLEPDVTIAHVPRADANGNGQIWGTVGEVRDAVFAADTVIVSAEEIVDEDVIRSDPNRTVFSGSAVDYLVEEPWGAHPSYVQGHYDRDRPIFETWNDVVEDPDRAAAWLDEWVHGVADRREYLAKFDGDRLLALRPDTNYATPVDMGGYR